MTMMPLTQLTSELTQRLSRAYVSYLAPANPALRRHLLTRYDTPAGTANALFASPVVQGKFPYEQVGQRLADLTPELLHPKLVEALDQAATSRFSKESHPYKHQHEAWHKLIKEKKSVIVTSGTGSGKTECFMVPILHDLAQQAAAERAQLVGVQALFLYPLNALIASQRERLSAWTAHWGNGVRFCLYNGETPNEEKSEEKRKTPQEVRDRKDLRASPPPILVTNATMLEYMLVRPDDAPLLSQSKGKLKYIVLDEAHSYLGSQAAEIALLLRRVLQAFGVTPADVQFIATSATIEGRGAAELEDFIAQLSGKPRSAVSLVVGNTTKPALPPPTTNAWPDFQAIVAGGDEVELSRLRYQALVASRPAQWLRDELFARAHTLDELAKLGQERGDWPFASSDALLTALDAASTAKLSGPDGDIFLPYRLHMFVRTQPGLWACANAVCCGKDGTELAAPDSSWAFGAVFDEARLQCSHCEALVYPLVLCRQCGGEHLEGKDHASADGVRRTLPTNSQELDGGGEEGSDVELAAAEDDEAPVDADGAAALAASKRLLAPLVGSSDDGVTQFDPMTGADRAPNGQRVVLCRPENGALPCGRCGQTETTTRPLFTPAFLSVPFTLSVTAPTLLEALPRHEAAGARLPLDGRRLLTFTDSRQGTARFAARLQQDAETRWVRSKFYEKALLETAQAGGDGKAQQDLSDLLAMPEPRGPVIERFIANLRNQLNVTPSLQASASFDMLAREQEIEWLHAQRRDWPGYPQGAGERDTAKMLFWREFARRPARQTSLETLGLVALRYPFLDNVDAPPEAWRKWSGTLAEWRDFLKLCVDFVFRANAAVTMPRDIVKWIGADIPLRKVCPPEGNPDRGVVRWPAIRPGGRMPRLGDLVVRAFGKQDDEAVRSSVAEILLAAWEAIRTKGFQAQVLQTENRLWSINLENAALVVPQKAWICPVSRRMLDTTLRGHTPYMARSAALTTQAVAVEMPRPPVIAGVYVADGATANSEEARQWLETDPKVATARALGAWTEFSDRIVLGQPYFRVAEHSAQISRRILKRTEDAFKNGEQNVLASSTTMEMGIDIGGLSGVAMNNAPPSPANFLQRAGRAGRRGESRALSLTVCRPQPHDLAVFRNPTWPFRTPMYVPTVRFDSERIVQRHVNARCLGEWLNAQAGNATRLTSEEFFGTDTAAGSPAELFMALLRKPDHAAALCADVVALTRGTCLEARTPETLLSDCAQAVKEAAQWFHSLRQPLVDQVAAHARHADGPNSEQGRALIAVKLALKRIDEEYLLSFLVERQVLPGHGFPTGLVPFNAITLAHVRQQEANAGRDARREDNRLEGTTRPVDVALREFAPGVELVVRGLVYRSEGVLLNWHVPPAQQGQQQEPQSLEWKQDCPQCEYVAHGPTLLHSCPDCGGTNLASTQYLVPAGFAVDFFAEPTTDLSKRAYVPVPPSQVYAGRSELIEVGRPALARYRATTSGTLTTLCGGLHGKGYALCLRCGRAESEVSTDKNAVSPLLNHRPLRGGRAVTRADNRCDGNDNAFSVKRHLNLGARRNTDVLELRLLQDGQVIKSDSLAWTLGVALSKALAEKLGVEAAEIGTAVQQCTLSGGKSIFLYDTAAGGAGFTSACAEFLPELLERAHQQLDACDCESACHKCLLSFSTQSFGDKLNRLTALAFLTQERLASVRTDPADTLSGGKVERVWEDGLAVIERLVRRDSGASLRLFVSGSGDTADVAAWTAGLWLLQHPTLRPRLVLAPGLLDSLDWQQNQQLASLCEVLSLEVENGGQTVLANGWVALAEIGSAGRWYTLVATAPDVALANHAWGQQTPDGPRLNVVESAVPLLPAAPSRLVANAIRRALPAAVKELHFGRQLDGTLVTLGERFWQIILQAEPSFLGKGPLKEVQYVDRYVKAPLQAAIVWRVLRWLVDKQHAGAGTVMQIRTSAVDEARSYQTPGATRDFVNQSQQSSVLRFMCPLLIRDSQAKCSVEIALNGSQLPHHRALTLVLADGRRREIRLDQGFGFLTTDARWEGRETDNGQAEKLTKASWDVYRQGGQPSLGYLVP